MNLKGCLKRIIYGEGVKELPFGTTMILFGLLLFNAMTTTMVFSYLPELVKTFGYTEVEKGTYVGYIASSMFISSTLCSFLWGLFADVKGKKLALILTASGSSLASLALGFSTNIYWACTARFMQGVFGVQVTAQTLLFSICDETNKVLAMTIYLLAYSVGLIIGPSIGGFLAFPADQYPNTFSQGSIFDQFKVLLPNLVLFGGLAILTLILICVVPNDTKSEHHVLSINESSSKNDDEAIKGIELSSKTHEKSKLRRLLSNKLCWLACMAYTLYQLVFVGFNELFPVWASTTKKYNGLELTTSKIGMSLMIAAGPLIIILPIVLSRVAKRFGERKTFIGSLLAQMILYPSYPPIAAISSRYGMWVVLVIDIIVTRVAVGASYLAASVIINDSVEKDLMGAANGLGITLGGIGRVISPAMFGQIYSWSIQQIKDVPENHNLYGFPFNQYFPFLIMSVLSWLNAYLVVLLPINKRKIKERTN